MKMPVASVFNLADKADGTILDEWQQRLIRHLQGGRAYIEKLMASDAGQDARAMRRGWYYSGPEDFVLREGKWYEPQVLPRGLKRGQPKACFKNAYFSAGEHAVRYVEGYALHEKVGEVPHAWCLDEQGKVLEVTLKKPGVAYLGVVFPREFALHGRYVVSILFEPGSSIFLQKWQNP